MGGKRSSKQELAQIETLTKEGLTCREIGQQVGRSAAAIRNLRYKKHLVVRAEDETKALFQQRDELDNAVKILQGQKRVLSFELDYLKKEKEKLETAIRTDRTLLQETLTQGLMNLKRQRPDLFTLSGPEQIAMLLKAFLK
jgi:IS30 family transposase